MPYMIVTVDGGDIEFAIPPSTVEFVDGASKVFTIQKKNDDGSNGTGAGEVVKITPVGGLVTINHSEVTLDANGQATFQVGPESRCGCFDINLTCAQFDPSTLPIRAEFKITT